VTKGNGTTRAIIGTLGGIVGTGVIAVLVTVSRAQRDHEHLEGHPATVARLDAQAKWTKSLDEDLDEMKRDLKELLKLSHTRPGD
jgi:hypothetical protein